MVGTSWLLQQNIKVRSGNLNSEFGTEGKGQKKKRSEGRSMWHEGASCWHVREVLYTFAGDMQAKGLLGVHLGPPNLALMNSHHPHPMASSCTRVCYCRHLRLNPCVVLLTSPHPNGRFFSPPPDLCCSQTGYQFIFFNFLMEQGWQTSLGRFRQTSQGWRHYFKKLLKLEPVDINVPAPSQIIF